MFNATAVNTIFVTNNVKELLFKFTTELHVKLSRQVDPNENIEYLISQCRKKGQIFWTGQPHQFEDRYIPQPKALMTS